MPSRQGTLPEEWVVEEGHRVEPAGEQSGGTVDVRTNDVQHTQGAVSQKRAPAHVCAIVSGILQSWSTTRELAAGQLLCVARLAE